MGLIKEQIQNELKIKIRDQIAQKQKEKEPPKKTVSGFISNVGKNVTGLTKGIVGLGYQAVRHPIESVKNIASIGKELIKESPKTAVEFPKQMIKTVIHPIKTTKKFVSSYKKLKDIPFEEQKKFFNEATQKFINEDERGKRILGVLGTGLLGSTVQEISHPIQYAYENPVNFALDVLSVGQATGANKVIAKTIKTQASKIPAVAKVQKALREVFTPNGKLINAGYDDLAKNLTKTKSEIFKVQKSIVDDTANKFYKEFKLNPKEQTEFFETIDKLRRVKKPAVAPILDQTTKAVGEVKPLAQEAGKIIPEIKATSANPKIQQAIDWWLNEEAPKLAEAAGLPKEQAIQNYLHHFFPEKFKGKEVSLTKPLQYSKKGYLKKSLDIEGFTKDPVLSISAIKSRVAVDNLRDGFIKNTIDKYAVKTNTLSQQLTDAGIDISRLDKNGLVEKAKQVLNLEEYKPKGNLRFYKQTIQEYIPEKTNLPKIEPKTIKLEPDLETWKLKEEVASLEESLAQNPVRELTKYANKKTRELGEVTGKTESGKFARLGDDMASELGYANSEEARKAYSEYIRSLDNFRKLKSELADKKSNLKIKDYTSEQLDKINKLITETEKYSVKTKTILGVSKKVETHLLPKAIVEELNKFTTGGKSTLDKMFLPFDVFNRNWKPLATAVRPRYHTRNVLGNIYNSTVVAGNNPISFILKDMPIAGYQQIKSVISNSIKSNSLLGKVYQKFFGKVVDPDIIKLAVDNDVIGRGFFGADINDLTTAVNRGDDIMKTIKSINTPAEIYKVPVLKQWLQLSTKVGQFLEDNARLALFKQGLKKFVGNVDESKKYVNDHLFDYLTGLGEGDKMIKRFIPFWSWTRFNIPLQSKSLISTPLRYSLISKATEPYKKQVELTDEGYQYLTPEQQSAGFIKVGTTKRAGKEYDKYIKTASVIPLDDLSRLTDILQGKNEEIGITPLKQIYNLITNDPTKFKTYFGQPVESFTGEKKKFLGVGIRGRTKELLSTIPLLTEINKLIGGGYAKEEKPQPIIRVEQVLSPLGVSLVDKESNKFFSQLEKEKELTGSYTSGLQQIYKKYLKLDLKNKGKEKYVSDNVKILEKILKQKGLNEFDLLKIKNSAIKALLQDSFKIK